MKLILAPLWLLLALSLPSRCSTGQVLDEINKLFNVTLPILPSSRVSDKAVFDYIVVGAGAAGSAAAYRLAKSGARVLLVEAGGDPGLLTRIPRAASGLMGSFEDWQYKTIPNNKSCLAFRGENCRFSRGRCVGGSTSINFMMYTRGNRLDYDLSLPGWTWPELKPYFLKYENNVDLDKMPPSSRDYHNTTGIMKLGYFSKSNNLWHDRIIRGFEALQFPYNHDVNAVSQIGVSKINGYVYKNERMSTARAYLLWDKVKDIKLKILKNSKCGKVIINNKNEAVGIEVLVGLLEWPLRLYARKEVILSAGSIGTPQILMLSGVGNAKHLEEFNIKVRSDLPVGDNLCEHILPLVFLKVDSGFSLDSPKLASDVVKGAGWALAAARELTNVGLTDVTAFVNHECYDYEQGKLYSNSSECELPTLQYIHAYINLGLLALVEPFAQHSVNLKDYIMKQLVDANENHAIISVSPVLLQPKSRGKIRLASTDPTDDPAIFANFLSEEDDVDVMLQSIKILEDLVDTPLYQKHNASILIYELEGCPRVEESWEGYWRCYMRHLTFSVYHAVGTAQLGAVLDACLRVRGVARLRVADLSAMPHLPRGNTAAVAIALGERVADFILKGCDFADS